MPVMNFEVKLEQLKSERDDLIKKKEEISNRFDELIEGKKQKIAQLEKYRDQIGRSYAEQNEMVKSANELAGDPAWVDQEPAKKVVNEAQAELNAVDSPILEQLKRNA